MIIALYLSSNKKLLCYMSDCLFILKKAVAFSGAYEVTGCKYHDPYLSQDGHSETVI